MSQQTPEPPPMISLPELGVGITYSPAIEPLLTQSPELFDVLEVEPQTTWIETPSDPNPYRDDDWVLDHIARLPGRKLVHSVGTPVGGTVRPDASQFELLRRAIDRFGSPWASDHLSFNSVQEFYTGFFLPPRQTLEGVSAAVRSISDLQKALHVPFAIETGVNYLRPRPDEMDDGAFVSAVVETANCGLLLDLHNIFANAINGRQSMKAYLDQIPLDRVWEIHIAGGMEMDGFWLDAHSGAIPEPLLEITQAIIPRLPNLKAIIFEIFPTYVPIAGFDILREQIEILHQIWGLRNQRCELQPTVVSVKPPPERRTSTNQDEVSPEIWEGMLGALVTGQHATKANIEALAELEEDPGIAMIARMIREFRASMVVRVLRLTSRLVMLTVGVDEFRRMLNEFWARTPPHQFATSETHAFSEYLVELELPLPHLYEILQFERAAIATLMDGQVRVVHFDFNPLPLVEALFDGRLPESGGESGEFEIELTADGPVSANGMSLDEVKRIFPFH